jgi:hypothetical protein
MSERPAWIKPAVLIAAGAATFAIAFHFSGSGGDDVVQPVGRSTDHPGISASAATVPAAVSPGAAATAGAAAPTATRAADPQAAPDLPTRTRITGSADRDPFAPKGWLPPPPPPLPQAAVVAAPPPPPTAPPIPFRFVGLFEEKSAKPAAFIAKGDALYVVRVGDVVENIYRVESFNSAQVVVTYLPLQQRQTIEVTGG